MKSFTYVEDYIEVINGDRDPVTGALYSFFEGTKPIISLARYDMGVVANMASTTYSGVGLTDKQAELATKIILNYKRQLEKVGIDVSPVYTPKFRLAIRTVDRSQSLSVSFETNRLELRFPYNTRMIDDIRDLAKLSTGEWTFDKQSKSWKIALTEVNLVAAYGFAKANNFLIAPEVKSLVDLVSSVESEGYSIELVKQGDSYTIKNAHSSLLEYIEVHCGGFSENNIVRLVDMSTILGYTVSESILREVLSGSKCSYYVRQLLTARDVNFSPSFHKESLDSVIEYATKVNRYPIYVYEPGNSNTLNASLVAAYFNESEVHRVHELCGGHEWDDNNTPKVVYFKKYSSTWSKPIPLLVSSHGMMYGGGRFFLLQDAQKVVYFVTEVYNNNTSRRDK